MPKCPNPYFEPDVNIIFFQIVMFYSFRGGRDVWEVGTMSQVLPFFDFATFPKVQKYLLFNLVSSKPPDMDIGSRHAVLSRVFLSGATSLCISSILYYFRVDSLSKLPYIFMINTL